MPEHGSNNGLVKTPKRGCPGNRSGGRPGYDMPGSSHRALLERPKTEEGETLLCLQTYVFISFHLILALSLE